MNRTFGFSAANALPANDKKTRKRKNGGFIKNDQIRSVQRSNRVGSEFHPNTAGESKTSQNSFHNSRLIAPPYIQTANA